MSKEYVTALKDSLVKKKKVLDEIMELGKLQTVLINAETMDYEAFDNLVNDRDVALENLEKLDEGFEALYERVRAELQENKSLYADEIKEMKELIALITDTTVAIENLDAENKKALENVFLRDRRNIAESKRSVSVAMNYYKSMNGLGRDGSLYLDRKN
mgnify:CR=1 FL=1